MKVIKKKIRKFVANKKTKTVLSDVGRVILREKELLTIQIHNQKKNEVCAMNWGMYATSSINRRLKKQNLLTVITKNKMNKIFIMIVDYKRKKFFNEYCKKESLKIIRWIK